MEIEQTYGKQFILGQRLAYSSIISSSLKNRRLSPILEILVFLIMSEVQNLQIYKRRMVTI